MKDGLLPLGRGQVGDIRDLKESGLLLPIRERDAPLLLTTFAGGMTAVVLSGPAAFVHFPVKLERSHSGLFVPDAEIVVDFASATARSALFETCGVLVLSDDALSIVAKDASNDFSNLRSVPLWTKIEKGSNATRIAFPHWGIAIRDSDTRRMLFEHHHGAEAVT